MRPVPNEANLPTVADLLDAPPIPTHSFKKIFDALRFSTYVFIQGRRRDAKRHSPGQIEPAENNLPDSPSGHETFGTEFVAGKALQGPHPQALDKSPSFA